MATLEEVERALEDAGSSHHEFESVYLNGVRDEHWAMYYAAFVLGRVETLTVAPSVLTGVLLGVNDDDWTAAAARAVHAA